MVPYCLCLHVSLKTHEQTGIFQKENWHSASKNPFLQKQYLSLFTLILRKDTCSTRKYVVKFFDCSQCEEKFGLLVKRKMIRVCSHWSFIRTHKVTKIMLTYSIALNGKRNSASLYKRKIDFCSHWSFIRSNELTKIMLTKFFIALNESRNWPFW